MKFSQLSGESCDCGEYGDSSQFLGSFESFFSCEYDDFDDSSDFLEFCNSVNLIITVNLVIVVNWLNIANYFFYGYSGLYCVSGESGDFSRSGYSAECDDSSVSLDFREYCDSDNSDEFYDFPQYGEFGDPGELGDLGEYGNSFDFGDFFLFLVNLVVWTHKYIMQYSIARNKYSMAVFICFPLILILTASLSFF